MEVGFLDLFLNVELTYEVVEILYNCYENKIVVILEFR